VLAGAVPALDVTAWRYGQMNPAVLVMIAAETGMSLNIFSSGA
jgi:hypothetical protein